jgi:hypothetical protein
MVVMCGRLKALYDSTGSRLADVNKKSLRQMVRESDHAEIGGVLTQTLSNDPNDRPAAADIIAEVRKELLNFFVFRFRYAFVSCGYDHTKSRHVPPRFNILLIHRTHDLPTIYAGRPYTNRLGYPHGRCFVLRRRFLRRLPAKTGRV